MSQPHRPGQGILNGYSGHCVEETHIESEARGSGMRNGNTGGVLRLTLNATSYDWMFIPVAGKRFTDAATGSC
jgi:hypothetical protein